MSIEKFIVSRDDSIYEAWPDVVLTDGGKLICVFSECEHHKNREGARLMITESLDRGRTWSKKKPLTEKGSAKEYFNCARISKLGDGSLAIICDKVYGGENKSAENFLWLGDAEGETWSEPIKLPFCGIVPDKYRQLKSGRIILAAHFKSPITSKLEQYLRYSDDQGATWSDRVTVAADPRYNLCEVSIFEYEDNKLVAYLRENSMKGYDILKVLSADGGETWSEIYNTPMDGGHRPVAGLLADGTVMVTYRYIPCGTQNMFAAFLRRDQIECQGRQEQRVRVMPLDYDRNPSPDIGYTGWVQFDDGEIYVVNYIKDDADKAYIRGYSFYPLDVVLPENENTTKNVF